MASIISASTTSATALNLSGDTTGVLQIATGATPTTAVTIDASQNTTFAGKVTSAGALTLASNGSTTALTIDTSQNVGIGTASPVGDVTRYLNIVGAGGAGIFLNDSNQGSTATDGTTLQAAGTNSYLYNREAGFMAFGTSNSERMRITSSGNVLFGTTSAPSSGLFRAYGNASADFSFGPQTGVGTNAFVVYNAGTTTGVYLVAGNTSWTSSSDERVKDIIEPITDAVNKVSTLRTVIGKYKTDEENVRRPFLIAQDVQAVLPEAVDASKPDNLGVQYTDIIPLLTAAIKEQQTIINDLKARVTALENK